MLNSSKRRLVISVFAMTMVGVTTAAMAQEGAPKHTPNPVIHADKAQIRADRGVIQH